MAVRHDPKVLASFQDGERCLVWARRKDGGGGLYRLEDGDARTLRPWAKEHLECFMPECPDRRLTTVARSSKRDGFSHYAGAGGHSVESEAHQQGKAALVAWVDGTLGPHGVVAVAEQSTSDRKRVADVMVTWPDRRQVALEVQYAPLSVDHWRTRHESYRDQGIVDVWLLGHDSKHLRAARKHAWEPEGAADGLVALGHLHEAMVGAGVPLLWINPVLGDAAAIGTVSVEESPHRGRHGGYGDGHDDTTFLVPPAGLTARAAFHVEPLDACRLTPDGLVTPTLDRLRAEQRLLTEVDTARRSADEAAAAAAEHRRRAAAERKREDDERRERWVRDRRELQQSAWDTSELSRRVLARLDGAVPALFTVTLGSESGVYAPREHLRAAVYRDLLWHKAGGSFTVADAYAAIRKEGIELDRSSPGPRARAVVDWLGHLERHGYVTIDRDPASPRTITQVTVLGDLEGASSPPPSAAAPFRPTPPYVLTTRPTAPTPRARSARAWGGQSQPEPSPALPGTANATEPERAAPQRNRSGTPPVAAAPRRPPTPTPRCRRCRLPLDPVLADTGLHVGC